MMRIFAKKKRNRKFKNKIIYRRENQLKRLLRMFLYALLYAGIFARRKCVVSLRQNARKQYACAISISELPPPLLHIQLAGANQHVLLVCE